MRYALPTLLLIALVALLSSCKTTEANYRAAYERTVAMRDSLDSQESSVYGRGRTLGSQMIVSHGDTIEGRVQFVNITPEGGGSDEALQRFNVVVGQFKQVFNARSLRNRLVEAGYSGAFVVHTAEPYYYVILSTHTERQNAIDALHSIPQDFPVNMRSPLPYILTIPAR